MNPFSVTLNTETGELLPSTAKVERRLKDMESSYQAKEEEGGNPLIYEVYIRETSHLSLATTILYPGTIGNEYYMTKGHVHIKEAPEVYIGVAGTGLVLTEKQSGEVEYMELKKGEIVYVPPSWAHRAVNTGEEPLVFLNVYPHDAGHDYRVTFSATVVKEHGKPKVKGG